MRCKVGTKFSFICFCCDAKLWPFNGLKLKYQGRLHLREVLKRTKETYRNANSHQREFFLCQEETAGNYLITFSMYVHGSQCYAHKRRKTQDEVPGPAPPAISMPSL